MSDYIQIVIDILKEIELDVNECLLGNLKKVSYLQGQHGDYGTYDINYTNRLKVAYWLLFYANMDQKETEDLVVTLFWEELKDRETDSFQGIGDTLEIFTQLLAPRNTANQYLEMFQKAKNANFDCACGYSWDKDYLYYADNIEHYTLEGCIDMLILMNYLDTAEELINMYAMSIEGTMSDSDLSNLKNWNKAIGNMDALEHLLQTKLDRAIVQQDSKEIASDCQKLVRHYIQMEKYEEAYKTLMEHITAIESFHTPWYRIGLGKYVLEDCMDIIIHLPNRRDELWAWCNPIVNKALDRMHGNFYKKCAEASRIMGESKLEQQCIKHYDRLFSSLNLFTKK